MLKTVVQLSVFCEIFDQSRSSLYAEYAKLRRAPKHHGPLALKDDFILVSLRNLANGYENMNDNVL